MKCKQTITLLLLLCFATTAAVAQKETLDLTTYTILKGWKKEAKGNVVQFLKEDKGTGAYCAITLYKSINGSDDPRKNFDGAWESLIKTLVKVTDDPQLQDPTKENDWTLLSGSATFESEGAKGVVILATVTGYQKMINLVIITNSNVFEKEITTFTESMSFKKPVTTAAKKNVPPTKPITDIPAPKTSSFTFTTTNFDDGWVSTIKEDWVEVTKGNIKVLLHFPNKKADAYNSVLKEGDYTAWNTLVAPRYSDLKNFAWRTIQSWQSISFVEADATENATGKTVHIVLFKKHYSNGSGRYLEFVADSKAAYEAEFGPYHNTEFDWDKTENMQYRNKFSTAPNDIIGKWSTTDYASVSYYYVNTGGLAGTTATSTADEFTFLPGDNYKSQHSGASGMVGNMKFSNQEYKGKSTVTNWNIVLTNRFKGASEKYDSYFEAVKGGRVLILKDRLNTVYTLVKKS